jgi:hypothetical protein
MRVESYRVSMASAARGKVRLHSATAAFRLAALLNAQLLPAFSRLAPLRSGCDDGRSPRAARRAHDRTGGQVTEAVMDHGGQAAQIQEKVEQIVMERIAEAVQKKADEMAETETCADEKKGVL